MRGYPFVKHPDPEVADAIVKLCDALCTWERSTGRQSVLILREHDFTLRAMSGKPGIPEDVTDEMLWKGLEATYPPSL